MANTPTTKQKRKYWLSGEKNVLEGGSAEMTKEVRLSNRVLLPGVCQGQLGLAQPLVTS